MHRNPIGGDPIRAAGIDRGVGRGRRQQIPGHPAVGAFHDAHTHKAAKTLAGAGIHIVRIDWVNRHGNNRQIAAEFGDGCEGLPGIGGEPDAAGGRADEKTVAVARVKHNGTDAPADVAGAQIRPVVLAYAGRLGQAVDIVGGQLFALDVRLQFLRGGGQPVVVVGIP